MGDTIVYPSVRYKGKILFVGPYKSLVGKPIEEQLKVTSEVFADCYRRWHWPAFAPRSVRLTVVSKFLSAWLRGRDYENRDIDTFDRDRTLEERILVAFLRKVGDDGLKKLYEETEGGNRG